MSTTEPPRGPHEFSSDHRCRCGYDGTGTHRCHGGRPDPHGTGEDGSQWCTAEAVPRLAGYLTILAGAQLKCGVLGIYYCDDCARYAGFLPPTPEMVPPSRVLAYTCAAPGCGHTRTLPVTEWCTAAGHPECGCGHPRAVTFDACPACGHVPTFLERPIWQHMGVGRINAAAVVRLKIFAEKSPEEGAE